MLPYKTLRLEQWPDVADVRREARASRVGKLDHHTYNDRPARKAAIRRTLKRRDRARLEAQAIKEVQQELEQDIREFLELHRTYGLIFYDTGDLYGE
jgi:hypothetical protein